MAERIAALYCVYNDDIWLTHSYNSVYPCVDAVYFFVSNLPWMGPKLDISQVVATIESFPDPEGKKRIIRGDWDIEIEQRNLSLAHAAADGFTIGMIVDADEIYEPSVLMRMIDYVLARPEVDVWHMCWYTYWKNPAYRIEPIEPYHPPVFTRLVRAAFVETRNLLGDKHELIPPEVGICHHMSYARNDEFVLRKINAFSHAKQIHPDWYEKVWKRWDSDPQLRNLHPVIPDQYQRAVPQPRVLLPKALQHSDSGETCRCG